MANYITEDDIEVSLINILKSNDRGQIKLLSFYI